jgi:hypothetical protein
MQTPASLELKWYQGMTNDIPLALYQDVALTVPIDITGVRWVFEGRLNTVDSSDVVIRKDSLVSGEITVADPTLGALIVKIPPSDTLSAAWKKIRFQVIGIWPSSGPTLPYFVGDINLEPAIASVT